MEVPNNPDPGVAINLRNELTDNLTVHKNVRQDIIITTSDKLKLVLINAKDAITSQRDWWTPAGLLIAFVTTFVTADFKEALGISKEVWTAIFMLLTIFSAAWLIYCFYKLYKTWGEADLENIIKQIKPSGDNTNK